MGRNGIRSLWHKIGSLRFSGGGSSMTALRSGAAASDLSSRSPTISPCGRHPSTIRCVPRSAVLRIARVRCSRDLARASASRIVRCEASVRTVVRRAVMPAVTENQNVAQQTSNEQDECTSSPSLLSRFRDYLPRCQAKRPLVLPSTLDARWTRWTATARCAC